MLVEGLCRIIGAPDSRKKKAEEGLVKLLGRDASSAQKELIEADQKLAKLTAAQENQGS
jgi:DNA topoisomerase-6 subunit B